MIVPLSGNMETRAITGSPEANYSMLPLSKSGELIDRLGLMLLGRYTDRQYRLINSFPGGHLADNAKQ